ncbi:MAG: 4-hydroxythreonine-4-phosphate dehydrogenase PdxA [Desulfovermiculus sp.]|nr:4-hydroxythreonine-4-phosphate dehydrogenase PdxA [Desulfovermiculus sp.]
MKKFNDPPLPLLLTLGDPNGIGPELVCRLHQLGRFAYKERAVVIIGPEVALDVHTRRLGLGPFWQTVSDWDQVGTSGIFCLQPPPLSDWSPQLGRADVKGGLAAGESLETACSLLLSGRAAGLITCPLNKAMLQEAGFDFPGHTEFLAVKSGLGSEDVCMLLAGDRLRVGLATTHPRLRDVPDLLTGEKIKRCLLQIWDFVQAVGCQKAPIGVCGLNPHAGEGGCIGDEEGRIIVPAIESASGRGIAISGPWPADSLFYRAYHGEFSAVLAMYHDQGLGPLKLVHFREAVNVTLGLPFVRTSVDHGTAYELVGKDKADVHSLDRSLDLAEKLVGVDRVFSKNEYGL